MIETRWYPRRIAATLLVGAVWGVLINLGPRQLLGWNTMVVFPLAAVNSVLLGLALSQRWPIQEITITWRRETD